MNEILSEGMIIGGLVVSIAYKFITGTYDFVSKKLRKQPGQDVEQKADEMKQIEQEQSFEAEGINPQTGKPRKFFTSFKVIGGEKHVNEIINMVTQNQQ